MSETPEQPDVDPADELPRDRHFHGKTPPHIDDDYLEHRTEHERVEAGLEDYVPEDVPDAEA